MPRRPRIHVPGAFYHVTLRGNHRQDIFFAPADRELLEKISAEVIERYRARIHAYCWMTNHVHLLMQVSDVPLGRLMLRIASGYARTVQARLHTSGHLFERRYHALLIDADEYLLEAVRYIHLNPVRAHMVATAAAYHWSSHLDYLAQRTQSWVSTDFALRLFHTDREAAIAAYRRFMDEGLDESSDFEAAILDERRSVQFPATPPIDSCQLKSRKSLAELIDEACQKFGVTPQVLASTCRHRAVTHVRAWIAHRAIMLGVASLSRVARAFDRSEASLRESVKHHFNFP
jgi:REP element-mobilizing transposase RayT